ncbi:MAG: hypothetical protein ACRDQA_11145 [Nocardioidaceae bacterium]
MPEDLLGPLAERARTARQSLNAFLLAPTELARRSRNTALLQGFDDRRDGVADDDPHAATRALERARADRDTNLGVPGRPPSGGQE